MEKLFWTNALRSVIVILAALPGMVRTSLVNAKLVKPDNFTRVINLMPS